MKEFPELDIQHSTCILLVTKYTHIKIHITWRASASVNIKDTDPPICPAESSYEQRSTVCTFVERCGEEARALRARRGVPSRRNPSWVLPLVSRAPINLLVGSGRQRAWQFLTARLTAARLSNREKRVPALSRGNELPCSTSFALSTTLDESPSPSRLSNSQRVLRSAPVAELVLEL